MSDMLVSISSLIYPFYYYIQYALLYDDIDNGGRAVWDDSEEKWKIPGLIYDDDNGQPKDRSMTKHSLHRPESDYARQRKLDDPNPRWHSEDIVELDIVMPTRSTPNHGNAANTSSKIQAILAMDVNANPTKTTRRFKQREEKYFTATDKKKKPSSRRKTKSPKSSSH